MAEFKLVKKYRLDGGWGDLAGVIEVNGRQVPFRWEGRTLIFWTDALGKEDVRSGYFPEVGITSREIVEFIKSC